MTLDEFGWEGAPRRRRGRTMFGLLFAVAVTGVLVAGLAAPVVLGVGYVTRTVADRFLAASCDVHEQQPPERSTLLARDGKTVIATFFTQNRAPAPLKAVPRSLVQALIATEDRRFYDHHGVDVRGILRAAVNDASGGSTQGGSTLTMQYVKQVRYYQATNDAERAAAIAPNLDRKLENAKCALQLERHLTKDQILERYLNIAFFGENSYGVATATKTYFRVPLSKLTLPQSAMLVGLLQAPSQYDPFEHADLARARRNEVIANMADVGYIDPVEALRYQRTPLSLASSRPPAVPEGCSYADPAIANAGFFCDFAVQWLHAHGISEFLLNTGGLRIVSSLDATLQTSGQRAVWKAGLKRTADYVLVMPSVDPATGAVTTMITSRPYGLHGAGHSVQPLFTAAYAGAGSTYKYFTATAALRAGAPTSLALSTPGGHYRTRQCRTGYEVHNAGDYPDTMPLSDALPQSSNTYFVALEDQFFGCRLKPIVDTALALGMNRLRSPLNSSASASLAHEIVQSEEPTFTLGQEPTAALELTGAFSAAANDGVFCPPRPVLRVLDGDGSPLPLRAPGCRRVLDSYVARTVLGLMRKDTHSGTASSYFQDWYARGGSNVAGKTGTDNNAADNGNSALWFVGLTPHLVATASLVNPDNPKQTVHDLPKMPGTWVGQEIFGAYASTFWLDAYGPTLRKQPWTWTAPAASPETRRVPDVVGDERREAVAALRGAGFRSAVFAVPCASEKPAGVVAYQQPPRAAPGETVTICLSSGNPVDVQAPSPTPAPAPVQSTPSRENPPSSEPEPSRPPSSVRIPTPTIPPMPRIPTPTRPH